MDAALFHEPRRRMIPIRSPWGDGEMSVLDFGDASRPPDVVFVHANGFNALTYRSLLAPLSASLRLIAPDLRGHGATRLPADPKGRTSWRDFRDDLIALLEALDGPPVTLAGHSMGATASLLAAERRPDRVSNLVLLDPVIFKPGATLLMHLPGMAQLGRRRFPWAVAAARRRAVFEDRATALRSYAGRGAFKGWPETAVADYVAGGLKDRADGQVELACAPDWEAANYVAQAHNPRRALRRMRRPVFVLKAENGSTCSLTERDVRRLPYVRLRTASGGDHFFPMRQPDVVRDAILDAAV
jgi:pimeloyl-ACP methyl ester carboxylesterase